MTDSFRDVARAVWDDECVPACVVCLDSDKPREAFLDAISMEARVAAFGAIRRAAQIARIADRRAFDWMDDPDNERYAMARGIRIAIRAALKGEA